MDAMEGRWDLEGLLPGGVRGEAFAREVEDCRAQLGELLTLAAGLRPPPDDLAPWRQVIAGTLSMYERAQLPRSLAICQSAADTGDEVARFAVGQTAELDTSLQRLIGAIGRAVRGASDDDLARLCEGELAHARPWLEDQRQTASLDLPPEQQDLLDEADRELLHGWIGLYNEVTSGLTARLDGEPRGVGQLMALAAHPDAEIRKRAFSACHEAYAGVAPLCATALTHVVGTRQMRADRIGVDELARSLRFNRLERPVLDAMWAGADELRPALLRYLRAKARLLGRHQHALDWWEVAAPVGAPDGEGLLSWEEAQALILEAFEAEPELAASARRLLAQRAVDVSDRPNKRAGAFCAPFGPRRTNRICATFSGTLESAALVAHELGHGWHGDILFTVPMARRFFTPAFAETASMYAEGLVWARWLEAARDPGRRLYLLDRELQLGVAMLLNLRARHDFERACYAMRREGPLTAPMLHDRMVRCEQEAYGDALASWDGLLWAKKYHLFRPRSAFQNWPYTFGYLFSSALRQRGAAMREILLRVGWDDGRGVSEALGVDFADPGFWAGAGQRLVQAALAFERAIG